MKLGESVSYRSAGKVEFIYDADRGDFFFHEVNTRLQVEHGVTELVMGIALVEWMIRLALDPEWTMPPSAPEPWGHAIQARVHAEDPNHNFRPSCGLLTGASFPEWTRCDGWIAAGMEVSPYYDPLLSKVMVHGADRAAAVELLGRALDESRISGIETNLRYLRQVARWDLFVTGVVAMLDMASFDHRPDTFDVFSHWAGSAGLLGGLFFRGTSWG